MHDNLRVITIGKCLYIIYDKYMIKINDFDIIMTGQENSREIGKTDLSILYKTKDYYTIAPVPEKIINMLSALDL